MPRETHRNTIEIYSLPKAGPPLAENLLKYNGNSIVFLWYFYGISAVFQLHFLIFLCSYFLISLFPYTALSQKLNADGTVDCTNPTEIIVQKDSLFMSGTGDYEKFEPSPTPLVFYRETDKYTFWYKLIIQTSAELTFDIVPSNPVDNYDYFLYRNTESNFCLGIIRKTILPIRANLFRNILKKETTGLSPESPLIEDTILPKRFNYLYSAAYHPPVPVSAGEEYYLNVHHTRGEDCGHFLQVSSGERSVTIQAIHKNCFFPYVGEEELEAMKAKEEKGKPADEQPPTSITPRYAQLKAGDIPTGVKAPAEEMVTISGTVVDTRKMKPLNAEIKVTDSKGKPVKVNYNMTTGTYQAVVPKDKDYQVVVNAVGYKEEVQQVKTGTSVSSSITMKPVAAGEKFVMEKIYFHPNTWAFRREAYGEMDKLCDYLLRNEEAKIEIEGHTNGNNPIRKNRAHAHLGEEWNFQGSSKKLSQMRADAVKQYLEKKSIDPSRLKTAGYGGDQPVITKAKTLQEALRNIRVEIKVVE